jgi:hypothetical protein
VLILLSVNSNYNLTISCILLDAKPGCEFIGESSPEHTGGGANGSMHKKVLLHLLLKQEPIKAYC